MTVRTIAAALLLATLVSGCATGPSMSELKTPLHALEQGKGRVFFYRTGIIGGAYQPDVMLNGAVVGSATPRAVYLKDVPPGSYTVTTSMTNDKVNFVLSEGQQQYVRISYKFGFNIYPELVDGPTGEKEVRDLSFVAGK
jgi:hypothetical protein